MEGNSVDRQLTQVLRTAGGVSGTDTGTGEISGGVISDGSISGAAITGGSVSAAQYHTGAVLLAAGLSSRMGDFKPLLPYRNTTIARWVVQSLLLLGTAPVFVVTGYRGKELEAHLRRPGVRFIRNSRYRETQMFDSVKLGLAAAAPLCRRIAVMPMDLPAIRPDTLRQALEAQGPIVRTVYQGEPGHPIVVEAEAAARLCGYGGNRGLRGALEESGLPITELAVGDNGVIRDVDTREEYRQLLKCCGQEVL